MGADSSKAVEIPSRNPGQASAFYCACRNGDTATVQNMLPNLTYEQINQIEPNGSTALHAASYYGWRDIVRLLLERGCSRTILNFHRKTAYEEAASDQIRALFHRPTLNRFVDENGTRSFKLLKRNGTDITDQIGVPDGWVKGYTSANEADDAKFINDMGPSLNPLKQIAKHQVKSDFIGNVAQLVLESVPRTHEQYDAMNDLFKKFVDNKNINHLLKMYTVETPFYTNLQTHVNSYAVLIYFYLRKLRNRAFQGRTFRGAIMTKNDIQAYQWALRSNNRVLETRVFQSTSRNKSIAQKFAVLDQNKHSSDHYSVLLTIHFPKRCPTAIDLTKRSDKLPPLSEYPNEEEVLILPYTLFTVKDIQFDSHDKQYYITLTNVLTPKKH